MSATVGRFIRICTRCGCFESAHPVQTTGVQCLTFVPPVAVPAGASATPPGVHGHANLHIIATDFQSNGDDDLAKLGRSLAALLNEVDRLREHFRQAGESATTNARLLDRAYLDLRRAEQRAARYEAALRDIIGVRLIGPSHNKHSTDAATCENPACIIRRIAQRALAGGSDAAAGTTGAKA